MNSQLSYSLAQAHHEQLHRDAERARLAAELSRPTRLSVAWNRILGIRSSHGSLQGQSPAVRPIAGGVGKV